MGLWTRRSDNSNGTGPQPPIDLSNMTGLERARHERHTVETAASAPHNGASASMSSTPITSILSTPSSSAASAPVATSLSAAPQPVMPKPEPIVAPPTAPDSRAQLFAGAGVKLKGEVTGCDSFRIEGDFDGQVSARQIVVVETGVFRGTAHVEEAEIEGTIEGTLHVTGHLFLRSSGKLQGNVSYGQIEIERGGQLSGDINPGSKAAAQAAKKPTVVPMDAARATAPK